MQTALYFNGKRFTEKEFSKERDFELLTFEHASTLFGQGCILIDAKKKIDSHSLGASIPDAFLFDLKDPNNPEFYLIEVELAKHSFYSHIFPQITKFFAFFKNSESQRELIDKLYTIIISDETLKEDFQKRIGSREIFKYVKDTVENSQNILLILDNEKKELPEIINTYTDTWGKMVKLTLLRAYLNGTDTILTLTPEFENIDKIDIVESEIEEGKSKVYSEEFHLEGVTPPIREIYNTLKTSLSEKIVGITFNPQRHYISLRKKRNFAFLQIRKKKIAIVALAKESVIRERITGYPVSTLTESVQKFYNGECATINIESADHLLQVIDLLVDIQK